MLRKKKTNKQHKIRHNQIVQKQVQRQAAETACNVRYYPAVREQVGKRGDIGRKASKKVMQFCGQIAKNRAAGARAEAAAVQEISQQYPVYAEQVTMRVDTAPGQQTRVRADIVAQTATGDFKIFEVKASSTAPYTRNQRQAYPKIFDNGATIVTQSAIDKFGTADIPPGTDGFRIEP